MRSDLTPQELSGMAMTQLVEYGRQAMQSGHYRRAASLLREAVRRAPMRQDLKDYLGVAIEGALIEEQASPKPQPGSRSQPRPAPEARRPAPENGERREPRPFRQEAPPRRDYDRAGREYDQTEYESDPDPRPAPRRESRPAPRPAPPPEPRPERRVEPRYEAPQEPRPIPGYDPLDEAPPAPHRPLRPEPRFELEPEPRPVSWSDPLDAEDSPPEPPRPQLRPAPRQESWNDDPAPASRPAARPRPARDEAPLAERGHGRPVSRPAEPPPARPQAATRNPQSAMPERPPRPRPEGRPEPSRGVPQGRAIPPQQGRPVQYRPADFKRRHQRGPASALILGLLVGFFLCGVFGAGAWFYFQSNPNALSSLRLPNNQADIKMALARASAYTSKGEYSKAIELLTSQPESPERNKALAEMFSDQGDNQITRQNPPQYEGAIEAYKSAVKYDPNNMHYRSNLASAYYQLAVSQEADRKAAMNSLDSAQQHCETVLNQDSKNLEALQILKRVALKKRDDTLLARTYKRIMESAPGSPEAEEAKKNLEELKLR